MKRLATTALLFAAAAVTAGPDDPKKAAEAIQGEWKFASFSTDGKPDPEEKLAKSKAVVTGDKFTVTRDGKEDAAATFTLDPKASPAAIDMVVKEGGKELTIKGIYKLDKDTLTLCFNLEGRGDRPKEFKSAKEVGLLVLERAKKK